MSSVELRRPRCEVRSYSSNETASRLTPAVGEPLESTSFTVTQIGQALARLGALPGLLQEMHGRILRNIIERLINTRDLSVENFQEASQGTLVASTASNVEPIGVVSNIRVVLAFVGQTLLPSAALEGRQPFLSSLRHAAFQLVLDRVLLPSMPLSLERIPEWLKLVKQASDWELEQSNDPSYVGILQQFLRSGAGPAWLNQSRDSTLRHTRRLVYDDWKTWKSKTVDDVSDLGTHQDPPRALEEGAIPENSMGDDDGWNFQEPQGEGSEDGWDFDDFTSLPTPQPATLPTKPVREAKRLGKKSGHKPTSNDSPAQVPPVESPPVPPASKPVAHPPTQRTIQHSSYQVSEICDSVIALATSAVKDMETSTTLW